MVALLLLVYYVPVRIRLCRCLVFSTVEFGVIHREGLAGHGQSIVLYVLSWKERLLKLDVCAQVQPCSYP